MATDKYATVNADDYPQSVLTVTVTTEPYAQDYDPLDYREMDEHVAPKSRRHTFAAHVLTNDWTTAVEEVTSHFGPHTATVSRIVVTRLPVIVPSKR